MTTALSVVGSGAERDRVFIDLQRTMNLAARLPNFPFISNEGVDSFCQDVSFVSGTFGTILEALALQYHDDFVSGARLEPRYFLDEGDLLGNYSAFHIQSPQVAQQYWRALTYQPNNNIAYAIYSNWDVVCVAGSSGCWAIWGERRLGIAIVRTIGSDMSWRRGSDEFLPPTEAIRVFIEPEFNRLPMPDDFRQRFLSGVRPAVSRMSE